jgi:TRAP-type C4-dicarboxylate transport system permease small subunit
VLVEAAAAGLFGLMVVASMVSIRNNLDNQTATLEMPYWLFMLPLTVGMLLLTLEHALLLVKTLRRGRAADKSTTLS